MFDRDIFDSVIENKSLSVENRKITKTMCNAVREDPILMKSISLVTFYRLGDVCYPLFLFDKDGCLLGITIRGKGFKAGISGVNNPEIKGGRYFNSLGEAVDYVIEELVIDGKIFSW